VVLGLEFQTWLYSWFFEAWKHAFVIYTVVPETRNTLITSGERFHLPETFVFHLFNIFVMFLVNRQNTLNRIDFKI